MVNKQHVTSTFFVNKPPDLGNDTEYGRFNDMVSELETIPNALGPEYTSLWLREYIPWISASAGGMDWLGGGDDDDEEIVLSYDDVPFFMERLTSALYNTMVKYRYYE